MEENLPKDQIAPVEPQAPVQPTTPSEPTTPVTPGAPAAPAFDVDSLREQVANDVSGKIRDEVSRGVIDRIGKALGLTKEEAEEQLPTNPKDLAKFVQENAKKGTEELLSQREQAEREAQEAQQRTVTEGAQRFQQLWRGQYDELASSGRVPKIGNPNDKQDPGNLAKTRILTKLGQIIKENQSKGIDYVPTLKEVFYEFPDVLTTATTAGAEVPISGGGRVASVTGGLPHDQLRNTSIEDLVAQKYK